MSILVRHFLGSNMKAAAGGGPTVYSANTANLDGSADYFSGGDNYDVGTSDFSLACWFKTTATTTQFMLSKTDSGNTIYDLYMQSDGTIQTRCQVDPSNNKNRRTVSSYNDGNWHHVIAFCDRSAGDWTIYVDGSAASLQALTGAGSITGALNNAANFFVGARDNGPDLYFNGELSGSGVAIGADLTADATELYNSGTRKCWGDLLSATQTKFNGYWELANWTGFTGQETTDQTSGGNNLTENGGIVYTGSIDVECS